MTTQHLASRRAFLGGVGAASLVSLAPAGAQDAKPAAPGARHQLTSAKAGSTVASTPPLAVRAMHRMGYGPARRRASAVPADPPGRIFQGHFETSPDLGSDDLAYFRSLGADDDARLAAYVEEQLAPLSIPDPDIEQRLAAHASSFAVMNQPLATTWSVRECQGFEEYVRPYREVEKAALNRAIYSRRQLLEVMVDFWHNHFNIFAGADEDTYVSWHSWDRDVIRTHALGNFYDFLHATARHPAMLEYLDNYENSKAGFNENYARELFELHTLGAENYRGLQLPLMVQELPSNPYAGLGDAELDNAVFGAGIAISNPARKVPAHYVDADVYAAARALTGWRYADANQGGNCGSGAFFTNQDDHDNAGKAVLGRGVINLGDDLTAELEGRMVLKMAAWHPGTATHIARKLCQRLIADDPPESIVEAAAATVYEHRLAPDQIKRTLRVILTSAEFKDPALWGSKTKRPFEYVASAMRAAGGDWTFRQDDASNTTGDFFNVYNATGHRLYWWRTPDGYPDHRSHWQGSNTLVQAWRTIDWLTDRNADSDTNRVMRIIDLTLARFPGDPSAREVVEFWCSWILGHAPAGGWCGPPGTLVSATPTTLGRAGMEFFTQIVSNTTADRDVWPADEPRIGRALLRGNTTSHAWNTRLRGLVALILWSPEFLQR